MPIVNVWMKAIGCIFIHRGNRKSAVQSIKRGVEQLQQGRTMVIFPEGTRSQGPQVNVFRHGSLKMPIRSKSVIVPVSISGSYRLKEQNRQIRPGKVVVTIHKPVDSTQYGESDTKKLGQHLTEIISGAV